LHSRKYGTFLGHTDDIDFFLF